MTEAMPALKKANHEEFAPLLVDGLPAAQTYGESRVLAKHEPSADCFENQGRYSAATTASRTARASRVPSASPFSKSSPPCPIALVTWARQSTRAPLARAKA